MSRRRFFGGLAASAAWFCSRAAFAAEGEIPRRLICFPMINGAPCGGEMGNLPDHHFWPENLSTLSLVTEPLLPYADRLTFLKGVWLDGAFNHPAIRSLYTGAFLGKNDYDDPPVTVPSIDQIIADHIQKGAAPAPLRSLHLGAAPADHIGLYKGGRSTFFFGDGGVALDYEANPVTAYDDLFGASGPVDPVLAETHKRLREKTLGIVLGDIERLAPKVSGLDSEAQKLTHYRDAVQGMLAGGPSTSGLCVPPLSAAVEALRPSLQGNAAAAYDGQYYPQIVEAQFDIMAHALICGLTRVATFQASSADNSQNAIVPVTDSAGQSYALHGASHAADQLYYAHCQRWFADQLARFLGLLNVPDPLCPAGNTVLDNSVVLWFSEAHPVDHGSHRLPMAYLGTAGGALTQGTIIDHDPVPAGQIAQAHHDLEAGPSHKALLKTVCKAFGVPDSETTTLGDQVIAEMLP